MKKILQVKYCANEQETNEFLKTLSTEYDYPKIHSIQYCARVQGGDNVSYSYDGDKQVTTSIKSDVIAIVQYFVEVEEDGTR